MRTLLVLPLLVVATVVPAHADQTRDAQWYLPMLRIPQTHGVNQGAGVTVAVVDTGVDASHPDLAGNVLAGLDTWNRAGNGQQDRVGHGTGVAALVAGHGHGTNDGILGIAPKARILPVNVKDPGRNLIDPFLIADGIRWAADRGAQVICVAIGASPLPEIQQAVNHAIGRGAVVVAAAGNTAEVGVIPAPALFTGVIAVSSFDRAGNFSPTSQEGPEVAVAGPGVDMTTARPGGRYQSGFGTSFAAAVVAGAAALIRSRFPDLPELEIRRRLVLTATDRGPRGKDNQYGFGLVNPLDALTAEVPSATPTTPADAPTSATVATGDAAPGNPRPRAVSAAAVLTCSAVTFAGVAAVVFLMIARRRRQQDDA